MDLGGRRKGSSTPKTGSIWESRMRLDEFKGGIKVFNATAHQNSEQNVSINVEDEKQSSTSTMKPKQSPIGKRKTWKSEGTQVQISKQRSELSKNLDKERKEVSVDGIRKSRSVNVGIDQSSHGNEKKDLIQLRKVKSVSTEELNCDLKKVVKSETSDGDLKKSVSSKLENVSQIETPGEEEEEEEEKEEEEELNDDEGEEEKGKEIEVEIEDKTLQIKEISVQEQRPNKIVIEEKKLIQSNEKTVQFSPIVKKKAPSTVNHAKIHPNPTKTKPRFLFSASQFQFQTMLVEFQEHIANFKVLLT
ncbi:hypothetical protein ACJIZ3_025232 [Penstemon smallii]|uniref:Uncharacterized protein n=1 Tax=Penstemon smallii TaxID=265156 RepID=A0ABD3TVE2_9LAMI